MTVRFILGQRREARGRRQGKGQGTQHPSHRLHPAVGVEPTKPIVSEVGKDHGQKGDRKKDGAAGAVPAAQRTGVQIGPVDEPGKSAAVSFGSQLQ